MSIRSAADHVDTAGASDPAIRLAFIGNVHRLLALGYKRLDRRKYQKANENLVTQDLASALRDATQDMQNPRWTSYFSIHEKRRQNDGTLQGNARMELDIVFERTQRGSHPHFVIEAKRLGPAHPVGKYLGSEGLGAFISCEYAVEYDEAGMLGYVQSRTVDDWSHFLESRLSVSPGNYSLEATGRWEHHAFRGGPATTYRSSHKRPIGRGPIMIYHTLLDFTT